MNAFIADLTQSLIENEELVIEKILLTGSSVNPASVDFWSDTDLVVIVDSMELATENQLNQSIENLGKIVGREVFRSNQSLTQRVILVWREEVQWLDIKMCTDESEVYGDAFETLFSASPNEILTQGKKEFSKPNIDQKSIEAVWFTYYLCVKKFMRDDHLIGLHLLLDLIREYLVLEMIERDLTYQTHIHRHGFSEKLPPEIALTRIDYTSKRDILGYIQSLSEKYEEKLMELFDDYEPVGSALRSYVQKSLHFCE